MAGQLVLIPIVAGAYLHTGHSKGSARGHDGRGSSTAATRHGRDPEATAMWRHGLGTTVDTTRRLRSMVTRVQTRAGA